MRRARRRRTRIDTDFFVAAAYAAGVTQREYDRSRSIPNLIHDRILPALRRPRVHRRFEDIMVSLTGGRRPFDREGFRMEEETNWHRAELLVASGIARNLQTVYRLGPPSSVTSREFNHAVIRLRTNVPLRRAYLAGNEMHGRLAMPLLTLHTTGDGQVPIDQLGILRRRVDAAGRGRLLVSRVFVDPGHCGFTATEWAAAYGRWSGGSSTACDPRATTCGASTTCARGSSCSRVRAPRRRTRFAARGGGCLCAAASSSTARSSTPAGWARSCSTTDWSRPAS